MSKDEIAIIWHIDDVKEVAPDITDEQAREVLGLAYRYHDAEVGINWDTLRYYANEVMRFAKEPISTREQARGHAVDFQNWVGRQSLSYKELADWQTYFGAIAKKFDLTDEFKENGVI